MLEKRHAYKRKRSPYRRIKAKTQEQLAWEEKIRTHSKLYYVLMWLLVIVSGYFFVNSSNIVFGVFLGVIFLTVLIVLSENEIYSLHTVRNKKGEIPKEKTVLWILAGREFYLSFIFILISFLLTNIILRVIPFQLPGKVAFNVLMIITFLIAFLLYYLYTKYELDRKIFKKTAKKEKKMIEGFEKKQYREFFLNITDLLAIVATILLLSNSTVSLVDSVQVRNVDDLLNTFEFKLLLYTMANYVPAIYLRIPK